MGYYYDLLDESTPITAIVEVSEDGEIELLVVEGGREFVPSSTWNDLNWFNEHYEGAGPEYMLFGDETPEPGKHKFVGRLISDRDWTDCGWEYDSRFEIDKYEKIG